MRGTLLKIFLLATVLGVCYLVFRQDIYQNRFRELPTKIEDFEALNSDGVRTTYLAEKGQATLIVLSASWCPACLAEIPVLQKLHREYSPKGFRILMVSEDDNIKTVSRFKKKYDFPWTVVHWNYDLMNKLGNPSVIPVSYLVRNDGKIEEIKVGDLEEGAIRSKIEKLLK